MPLYVLGLMGVTRRMSHFDDPSLQIWFIIAALGAALIAVGIRPSDPVLRVLPARKNCAT
jgi:heme/copper-type cytochrome/quinol oxidase subunit 1